MSVNGRCSFCGLADVKVEVLVPANLSSTGQVKRKRVGIDACIADIVAMLNRDIVEPVTAGCCCGHGQYPGEIALVDGRYLIVWPGPTAAPRSPSAPQE